MKGHRISITGSFDNRLKSWLTGHLGGHERGALVLFRKMDRTVSGLPASTRFVAVDVIEMDGDWVLDSSPVHLRINLRKFQDIYLRCEQERLELGFAHSHPGGILGFSTKDDQNEQSILRGYAGCNGPEVSLVAMILADGQWRARVRPGAAPQRVTDVRHVCVLGTELAVHINGTGDAVPSELLTRQEAAFGEPFNEKLKSLRVAIVGGGGTGSSVATLIARAGVGELIVIDGDLLEESNLNRVRGYRRCDIGESKAATLARYIRDLGLILTVVAIEAYVNESPEAVDAVSSADLVFGCTDDVAGREVLNQAVYYYCQGLIDCGLTGNIDIDQERQPYLRDHRGRVSTVLPESGGCLRCQGVVTEEKLSYESALKARPSLVELDAETLREEYYLVGGGERAPGVGPFTSATADMAVATLFDLVRPYRQLPSDIRRDNIWYDFVHMTIYSNMPNDNTDCFCCGPNGLLLEPENGYRLRMPSLGKMC
ncbi:ThiF family adenylyltransferase [Mesorhizobium sp. VK23B]|uniref:ThiF family adenylyltransferase n=1 Tax=Mesorhizobium dulcispinae TaxID=3072316 RepID=A0ABU4XPZ2_9HYPH|nr:MULTISPECIES: ThiF family adenylyltransferase [unclassified Mesorhizobium]MDX8469754.1 ThiF family adenylyltransferase [Mesorhizobium sp. VK23B]MDX8476093.1 ThiF family adenylyltransferase [Mesorhizobium sp. VK23A]